MLLIISLAFLPVFFAHKEVPCDSCCPSKPSPDGDAEICSHLSDKIVMLENAIKLSACAKGSVGSAADAGVCMTVTMQAIPPCMLKKGSAAQGQCLIEAANAISEEMNIADRDSGLEIVKKCKCDAFTKMLSSLVTVKDMICVSTRGARYSAAGLPQYSANTLWFQYAMCQGLHFSCYFFTNNWNQGDFGQYYLYDNLLGDGNLLGGDNSLLPLLALSGGLGGGLFGGGQGGYGRTGYLANVATACDPANEDCERKGHSADVDCLLNPSHSDCERKGHSTDVDCLLNPSHSDCKRKRRSADVDCLLNPSHSDCERKGHSDDVDCLLNPSHSDCKRKRRSTDVDCLLNPSHSDCKRKRRSTDVDVDVDCTTEECKSNRRRRSANSCKNVFDCADDQACVNANANTPGTCQ